MLAVKDIFKQTLVDKQALYIHTVRDAHGRPQGGAGWGGCGVDHKPLLEMSRYIYFNVSRKKLPTISAMHYA